MPRICAGCRQLFASNEAFELHATGLRKPIAGMLRRCRSRDEMLALGMSKQGPADAWTAINRNPKLKIGRK